MGGARLARAKPAVIAIRIDAVEQLFDMLDPLPFRQRDLDPQAADYIVGWAAEMANARGFTLEIHLPDTAASSPEAGLLPAAIAGYFRYRADQATAQLKALFRNGRHALLIGVLVLAACVGASQALASHLGSGPLAEFIRESLIILGWVANWRPIQIFLYDWWPIRQRRSLLRRLADADVKVKPQAAL